MSYVLKNEEGGALKIVETEYGPFGTYEAAKNRALESMTMKRDILIENIDRLNREIDLLNVQGEKNDG